MLNYNELQKGITFIMDGEPYEVVESQFSRMQQRKPVMQAKIKNLVSGKVVSRTFHQNESFEEAEIERKPMKFIFEHRGQYTFSKPDNPSERISLEKPAVGESEKFLKTNLGVNFKKFGDKVIGIELPIKVDYIVKEAPPAEKGNTAQGGNKEIILENELAVTAPMFINPGDIVRVNTQTGEYVERSEKK